MTKTQKLKQLKALSEELGYGLWDRSKAVADVWHVDDVLDHAEANERKLTPQQALDVLQNMEATADACLGYNWDVLDTSIDNVLEEAGNE